MSACDSPAVRVGLTRSVCYSPECGCMVPRAEPSSIRSVPQNLRRKVRDAQVDGLSLDSPLRVCQRCSATPHAVCSLLSGTDAESLFLRGHEHAFAFFGGVPKVLLYDNLGPLFWSAWATPFASIPPFGTSLHTMGSSLVPSGSPKEMKKGESSEPFAIFAPLSFRRGRTQTLRISIPRRSPSAKPLRLSVGTRRIIRSR